MRLVKKRLLAVAKWEKKNTACMNSAVNTKNVITYTTKSSSPYKK